MCSVVSQFTTPFLLRGTGTGKRDVERDGRHDPQVAALTDIRPAGSAVKLQRSNVTNTTGSDEHSSPCREILEMAVKISSRRNQSGWRRMHLNDMTCDDMTQ